MFQFTHNNSNNKTKNYKNCKHSNSFLLLSTAAVFAILASLLYSYTPSSFPTTAAIASTKLSAAKQILRLPLSNIFSSRGSTILRAHSTMTAAAAPAPRTIQKVFEAKEQAEGQGARVRRSIGTPSLRNFSPFLMLDHFSIKPGAGFPDQ